MAGSNSRADANTFLGAEAGESTDDGNSNVFLGKASGDLNTSGSENIFAGRDSGSQNPSGNKNIFLGKSAGWNNTGGDENILIGFDVTNNSPNENLWLKIGNLIEGDMEGNTFLYFNGETNPSVDDQFDLGDNTFRWKSVWATDGTINTSDRRDKENIQPLSYGLDEVMNLNPVSFTWKNDEEANSKLGLIAQDLLQIIPEVVKNTRLSGIG